MAKKNKKITYGNKELYVIAETTSFYFVSENKDGTKQYPLSKMEIDAYNKSK
tara:strand:+ start:1994 stop:2149 length:156 start_codon:yes stop_codon:yes gene_type:complete